MTVVIPRSWQLYQSYLNPCVLRISKLAVHPVSMLSVEGIRGSLVPRLCIILCVLSTYTTVALIMSIRPQNHTVVEGQTVGITLEFDSNAFDDEFNVTLVHMNASATGEVSCSTQFIAH